MSHEKAHLKLPRLRTLMLSATFANAWLAELLSSFCRPHWSELHNQCAAVELCAPRQGRTAEQVCRASHAD